MSVKEKTRIEGKEKEEEREEEKVEAQISPIGSAKISLQNPVMIAGFPDNGMIGSICINHIIEDMKMHQIAFVDSEYIMASALFVGKKLRHPFRIYSNESGTVCAILCEVPVLARGVRAIVKTLTDWLKNKGTSGITIIGGINPSDVSPSNIVPRTAFLLKNEGDDADHDAIEKNSAARIPTSAFIGGMGGALLSSCVANDIKCSGLFVPSLGEVPDPGGAVILLEALASIIPEAKVGTERLRNEAETIKKHLEDLLKMQQNFIREHEKRETRNEAERIYK